MRARGPGFTVRALAGFLRRIGFLGPRAAGFDFALADFFFGLGFFFLVGFFLAMKKVYHLEAMSTTQAVLREPPQNPGNSSVSCNRQASDLDGAKMRRYSGVSLRNDSKAVPRSL